MNILLLLFLATLLILFPQLTISQCTPQDKQFLLQIKSHFNGVGLLKQWVPTTDCCTWPLIGCENDDYSTNPFRVNSIIIPSGTGFKGTIPSTLGNLPYLNVISFTNEPKLTGPIPQFLSKLIYLRFLGLSNNGLSGSIPAFLGHFTDLTEIDLSGNGFTGPLPRSIGMVPSLYHFNVSHNVITRSIPNMPKSLTRIDVSFNELCGKIPSGLSMFDASVFGHNKCLCGPPLPACN